jgi:moderate conductance mechanosensitive channel
VNEILQHLKILDSLDWKLIAATALRVCVILALAMIAMSTLNRVSRVFREHIKHRIHDAEQIKRAETLALVFRYVAGIGITGIAGMLILSEIGVSIAPILGAAGVVGIAVGFGAQTLIKDYFTGFFILVENQIRQGDYVEAAGKGGVVEEITLRHLRLRDYDGTVVFIPNNLITTVANMSRDFAYAVIDVTVASGESIDEAINVMLDVGRELHKDPFWGEMILADLAMAGVEKWGDASLPLRARLMTQPMKQADVRREYLRRLKIALDTRHRDESVAAVGLKTPALSRPSAAG